MVDVSAKVRRRWVNSDGILAVAPVRAGLSHHCVLAHQNNTGNFALSSQTLSDLMHLLRADIVNGDDENRLVFFQQALELVKIAGLVACLAPHVFLELKIGYLRVKIWMELCWERTKVPAVVGVR